MSVETFPDHAEPILVADCKGHGVRRESKHSRTGQTDTVIYLLERQRAAVADDVGTVKRRLHDAASNLAKLHWPFGAPGIGGAVFRVALLRCQIARTTHLGSAPLTVILVNQYPG